MQRVSATRSELLARRASISLAVQGQELLTEKRAALTREFDRLKATVLAGMENLEVRAAEARLALGEAVALDGPEAVGSASLAAAGDVTVEIVTRQVAGVPIVELSHETVSRSRTGRGYSLAGTTAKTDRVAEKFEGVVEDFLDVVVLELSLRRLAEEISRTTRRVNALEHVVIPRLETERDYIAVVLDERELENRVRLMRAKSPSKTPVAGEKS